MHNRKCILKWYQHVTLQSKVLTLKCFVALESIIANNLTQSSMHSGKEALIVISHIVLASVFEVYFYSFIP